MTTRDARWLTLGLSVGSLVFPAGIALGHLLHHRSIIYPH